MFVSVVHGRGVVNRGWRPVAASDTMGRCMKRPPYHGDARGNLETNMTPMIDVIFNLLIFFVCTASFQEPERRLSALLSIAAGSQLPSDAAPELQDFDEVIIQVRSENDQIGWIINERAYVSWHDVRAVLTALAAVKNDVAVILDIGRDVALGEAIDLYDLCRLVGFQKIQFAAKID